MNEPRLKTITVKPETLERLNRRRAELEMACDGKRRYSINDVICHLLDKEPRNG